MLLGIVEKGSDRLLSATGGLQESGDWRLCSLSQWFWTMWTQDNMDIWASEAKWVDAHDATADRYGLRHHTQPAVRQSRNVRVWIMEMDVGSPDAMFQGQNHLIACNTSYLIYFTFKMRDSASRFLKKQPSKLKLIKVEDLLKNTLHTLARAANPDAGSGCPMLDLVEPIKRGSLCDWQNTLTMPFTSWGSPTCKSRVIFNIHITTSWNVYCSMTVFTYTINLYLFFILK